MTTLHDPISEEAAAHIVHTAAAVGVSRTKRSGELETTARSARRK